ncbi:MAG: DHH family phosphoesterase [Oscillospiraceae bacterium]|nr:DHH family phosphoesterase [Oscillospiraceae bacterium]
MKTLKNFYRDGGLIIVVCCLIIILFILTGYIYRTETHFFWMIAPFVVLVSGFCIGKIVNVTRKTFQYFAFISEEITEADKKSLYHLPLSVVIIDSSYHFIWFNKSFTQNFEQEAVFGNPFSSVTELNIERLINGESAEIKHGENYYEVSISAVKNAENSEPVQNPEEKNRQIYVVYFEDITERTLLEIEKKLSKPVVMLISVDNYEEMFEGAPESEKAHVTVKIDKILEDFTASTTGIMKKFNRDRNWAVIEQRHVDKLIEEKVKMLDKAREIAVTDRVHVTLSIGIGATGKSIHESEKFARQALEMAQGRGGDQAAVKTAGGFEFYGGVSKGVERQNKVKIRIIANALADLIKDADKIFIMGHKSGDLDSVGSSIGLAFLIRNLSKEAYIAVDRGNVLCTELLEKCKATETPLFIPPAKARELLNDNSLLIITDTHNPKMLEDFELYRAAKKVVVIDHHRKMVNHVDNALIFFHEAYASSASEMVTELLPYFGEAGKLSAQQAEALLSGIMLDTKNFTVRTGVRTFEAAALLRKLGADTVSVKSLFANSFDSYKKKVAIVSSAIIYKKCAIAYSGDFTENMRLVSPQAADEMLSISGVVASFVVFRSAQHEISISARSLGEMNVQLIMENIGGGGHHTMAGAQFQNISITEARDKLTAAIDKYFELKT